MEEAGLLPPPAADKQEGEEPAAEGDDVCNCDNNNKIHLICYSVPLSRIFLHNNMIQHDIHLFSASFLKVGLFTGPSQS